MSDTKVPEGLPIVPHLSGEFFAWLWWTSEQRGSSFDLGPPVGAVDVWVDERLAFRNAEETKVSAVMTGDNPSASLEARAALAGGKILQEIRLGLRREDREYFVTLKGPAMDLAGAQAAGQMVKEGHAKRCVLRAACSCTRSSASCSRGPLRVVCSRDRTAAIGWQAQTRRACDPCTTGLHGRTDDVPVAQVTSITAAPLQTGGLALRSGLGTAGHRGRD